MTERVAPASSLIPKLHTTLAEGYGPAALRADVIAGLTVAVVALPLSMALAIASGVAPQLGLVTAVVAGFVISALGGSRVQIGGPTGAFVVIVAGVVVKHGYAGLVEATLMAGAILVVAGLCRVGRLIHYVPESVIAGFTAGIAVVIASSQFGDALGLHAAKSSADFIPKMSALFAARASFDPLTFALTAASLVAILGIRRFWPKAPSFLIVVVLASFAVWAFRLPVATIASRFGAIPAGLPLPHWPAAFTGAEALDLLPSALSIAFLAGVESLLSAVVADSLTGRRHRSDAELVAQGAANIGSALFGGMPATGAIARTATNIRAGAKTPVAGMAHAGFLLVFMLVLAPVMGMAPLASLAAILLVVAWNMSEAHKLPEVLKGPKGPALVLFATLLLTVFVNLMLAIAAGCLLAAGLAWMNRRSAV
jgi:SulP family sulfate permease